MTKRIPLSKAKSILYRTRGAKSRAFPHGMERELDMSLYSKMKALPISKARTTDLRRQSAIMAHKRREEKSLIKLLKTKKRLKIGYSFENKLRKLTDKDPIPF